MFVAPEVQMPGAAKIRRIIKDRVTVPFVRIIWSETARFPPSLPYQIYNT